MRLITNQFFSKLSQTHAVMAVFEKTTMDRTDTELLAKMKMTKTFFLSKIARKVLDNISEMLGPDHLLMVFMKQNEISPTEFPQFNYISYLEFVNETWEVSHSKPVSSSLANLSLDDL